MLLMLFLLCLHPSCTVNLVYHPDLQWPLRTRLAEYPACGQWMKDFKLTTYLITAFCTATKIKLWAYAFLKLYYVICRTCVMMRRIFDNVLQLLWINSFNVADVVMWRFVFSAIVYGIYCNLTFYIPDEEYFSEATVRCTPSFIFKISCWYLVIVNHLQKCIFTIILQQLKGFLASCSLKHNILELRILEIHSFPHFFLTCFDKFSWNLKFDVCVFNAFLLDRTRKVLYKIAF